MEQVLFRASSIGHLMTEPKSKADKDAGNLSESAKTHLVDVFVRNKYGRQTDITNKFIEKGLMVEEDGITLYSRVTKDFYKKNETHLKNNYIMGTPDIYRGPSIHEASHIVDIKCSWDIFTFFRNKVKKINTLYYWQLQSYMALTGAKTATLAYCLIDTPECFINDEKRKLFYKMAIASEENPVYLEACYHIEKSMLYGDIPLVEKVIEFHIDRNDEDIERLYKAVEKGREYLLQLEDDIQKLQAA